MTGPTEDEEKEEKHEHHLKDDAEAKLARHLMMTMMMVMMVMIVEQAPGHGSHQLEVVCEGGRPSESRPDQPGTLSLL